LAGLAVSAAVALAALAEPILVFTSEAQFLALPTTSPAASLAKADAPGSNLESLRGQRKRESKKSYRSSHGEGTHAHQRFSY